MNRSIEVLVEDTRLEMDPESVVRCLQALDEGMGLDVPEGAIEVAFVEPETSGRLHQAFFGIPDVTDVMTFPGEPGDGHAGDIAICPEVAADGAREYETSFAEELTLYLVHAWLHLAGLQDDSERAMLEMRHQEARAMELLEARNRLIRAQWAPGGD